MHESFDIDLFKVLKWFNHSTAYLSLKTATIAGDDAVVKSDFVNLRLGCSKSHDGGCLKSCRLISFRPQSDVISLCSARILFNIFRQRLAKCVIFLNLIRIIGIELSSLLASYIYVAGQIFGPHNWHNLRRPLIMLHCLANNIVEHSDVNKRQI